jgi:hypothetical protein
MAYARRYVIRQGAVFKLGGVDYSAQVTKARLVPDTSVQTLKTFSGVDQDKDTTTWTLELAGHQDRGTGSLGLALDTASAAGTPVTFCIIPASGTGQDQVTGSVLPVPMEFGGEVGSWKSFELTLNVVDQPTFSQTT